jgi:hypothetical protein
MAKKKKTSKRASASSRKGQNTTAVQSSAVKAFNNSDIENSNPAAAAAFLMMQNIEEMVAKQNVPAVIGHTPDKQITNEIRKVICFSCKSPRSALKPDCYRCGFNTLLCDTCGGEKTMNAVICDICGL